MHSKEKAGDEQPKGHKERKKGQIKDSEETGKKRGTKKANISKETGNKEA